MAQQIYVLILAGFLGCALALLGITVFNWRYWAIWFPVMILVRLIMLSH